MTFFRSCQVFYLCRFSRNFSTEICRPHVPVMANEVLSWFNPKPGQVFLDMTFGAGGHSKRLLDSVPGVKIIALDRDPISYEYACALRANYPAQVIPLLGKFSELPTLLKELKIGQNSLDGILFDFGCSSMQFDCAERGFSISKDGPLDMRMDGLRYPSMPTAADVVAHASEQDLIRILKVYGEEKQYKKIARAMIEARYTFRRVKTTSELKNLVEAACGETDRRDKLQRPAHVATKTFQGLRIFVNNEVNELNYGMILAQRYLKIGGACIAISFHSLEDTIVKRHLLGNVIDNAVNALPLKYSNFSHCFSKEDLDTFLEHNWKCQTKHVVLPTEDEVQENPRSRSAKLRVAVKVK